MTRVRFSGGRVLDVNLSFSEVREMLREALANDGLLEFRRADGHTYAVNAHQVQIIEPSEDENTLGTTTAEREVVI